MLDIIIIWGFISMMALIIVPICHVVTGLYMAKGMGMTYREYRKWEKELDELESQVSH